VTTTVKKAKGGEDPAELGDRILDVTTATQNLVSTMDMRTVGRIEVDVEWADGARVKVEGRA
jgi:hypothetical protein